MTERRYTDQEVARLLQRAADIDRDAPSGAAVARGLSLAELQEIAAEAGIAPTAVARAADEIAAPARSRVTSLALGDPGLTRRTAALPVQIDRAGLGRMVEVIDAEAPAAGTVGEALGSVRWTATSRFLHRQVVVQPSDTETVIRVEERYTDRLRAVVHLLPALYGAGGGAAVAGAWLAGGSAAGLAAAAGSVLGLGLGRALWNALRARSWHRVDRLSERLAAEANALDRSS
ncbi:hypothetical protein WI372_00455 [Gemmatimonadota bacterium DH-20]|uniref:Uncharacterized protein n=1 Tax=Gaopeijia maritima TaxID=3119007 RepID=A0ABU9E5U3_9BACT